MKQKFVWLVLGFDSSYYTQLKLIVCVDLYISHDKLGYILLVFFESGFCLQLNLIALDI